MSAVAFDAASLISALSASLSDSADGRTHAAEYIVAAERVPGFPSALLQLLATSAPEVSREVAQAASIQLKRLVAREWDIKEPSVIADADRDFIKSNVVAAAIAVVGKANGHLILSQILETVSHILRTDFPQEWPQLFHMLAALIADADASRRLIGVCFVRIVCRRYRITKKAKRKALDPIVEKIFPQMMHILQRDLAHDAAMDVEVRRQILKSVFASAEMGLPKQLRRTETFTALFECLIRLVSAPYPQQHTPAIPNRDPFEKCRKWAMRILSRVFELYRRRDTLKSDADKAFSKLFMQRFAPTLAATALHTLTNAYVNGRSIHSRVLHLSYLFIADAVLVPSLRAVVQNNTELIIGRCMLNTMRLTAEDIALWQNDPAEIVRRSLAYIGEQTDPKFAAKDALMRMIKSNVEKGEHSAINTLTAVITHCFDVYERQSNAAALTHDAVLYKDAAMNLLGIIRRYILRQPKSSAPRDDAELSDLEALIVRYVMADITSPIPFLRARAIQTVGLYHQLKYTAHAAAFAAAVERVCLSLSDAETPVRLESANAITRLARHQRVLRMIQPHFGSVLGSFFALIQDFSSEDIIQTLGVFVNRGGPAMKPFIAEICQRTCDVLIRCRRDATDDEDALFAVNSAMTVIMAVIVSIEDDRLAVMALMPMLEPAILECVGPECVDFFDDVVELLIAVVENGTLNADIAEERDEYTRIVTTGGAIVPPFFWRLYPFVCLAFYGSGVESMKMIAPFIEVMFVRDPNVWLNGVCDSLPASCTPGCDSHEREEAMKARCERAVGQTFAQMTFDLIADLLRADEFNAQFACKLIGSILSHYRGRVDGIIPGMVHTVYNIVASSATLSLPYRCQLFDVFACIIMYDVALANKALMNEWAADCLNRWMSHIDNDIPKVETTFHHHRLAVVAMTQLLNAQAEALTPLLQSEVATSQILKLCINTSSRLMALYKKLRADEEDGSEAEAEDDGDGVLEAVDDGDDSFVVNGGADDGDDGDADEEVSEAHFRQVVDHYAQLDVDAVHFATSDDEIDEIALFLAAAANESNRRVRNAMAGADAQQIFTALNNIEAAHKAKIAEDQERAAEEQRNGDDHGEDEDEDDDDDDDNADDSDDEVIDVF